MRGGNPPKAKSQAGRQGPLAPQLEAGFYLIALSPHGPMQANPMEPSHFVFFFVSFSPLNLFYSSRKYANLKTETHLNLLILQTFRHLFHHSMELDSDQELQFSFQKLCCFSLYGVQSCFRHLFISLDSDRALFASHTIPHSLLQTADKKAARPKSHQIAPKNCFVAERRR